MRFQHHALVIAIVACLSMSCKAENPQPTKNDKNVVPLKSVWAWKMPGTLNVEDLERNPAGVLAGNYSAEIARALSKSPDSKKKAPALLFVPGTGKEALQHVYDVLVKKKKPLKTMPAGRPSSLVFFSYNSNQYVHLKKISLDNNSIEIQFHFVPHKSKEMTSHFALIPLSGLSAGKHQIKLTHLPLEKKYADAGFNQVTNAYVEKTICSSTHITVTAAKSH